jgi:hypothetical protein
MGPLLLLFMSSGRGSGGKIPNQQGTDDGEKCESNCGAKTLFVAHVKWLHCGPDRPGCQETYVAPPAHQPVFHFRASSAFQSILFSFYHDRAAFLDNRGYLSHARSRVFT